MTVLKFEDIIIENLHEFIKNVHQKEFELHLINVRLLTNDIESINGLTRLIIEQDKYYIQKINIYNCPNLKRIDLQIPRINLIKLPQLETVNIYSTKIDELYISQSNKLRSIYTLYKINKVFLNEMNLKGPILSTFQFRRLYIDRCTIHTMKDINCQSIAISSSKINKITDIIVYNEFELIESDISVLENIKTHESLAIINETSSGTTKMKNIYSLGDISLNNVHIEKPEKLKTRVLSYILNGQYKITVDLLRSLNYNFVEFINEKDKEIYGDLLNYVSLVTLPGLKKMDPGMLRNLLASTMFPRAIRKELTQ
jgi:hypothetical protein